ncbi:MAG: hypothetical protein ACYTG3_00050 [Planctomycetota bacterium]|jgi:hypothetical protein
MPAEQRIIGGGLLMVGVVIVLVLIFLFTRTTVNAPDAHQEIVSKHWPAYMKARDQDSYLGVKNAAEEILRVLDEADRVAVVKLIKADATTDREVRQLQKLIESGGLEKNVDGLFEFEREWYVEKSHRALRQLSTAIDGVKVVKEIRTAARDTRSAIDEIRLGSGLPLEPAPAGTVPKDDIAGNPVYANDAELFRVLGVEGEAVLKALQTKGDSAKARSARLRWNAKGKDGARAQLAEAVQAIPAQAESLTRTATTIGHAAGNLAGDADATRKGDALLGKAVVLLGSGLDAEHAAVFKESREKFRSVAALAAVLKNEADMLKPYVTTAPGLGAALGSKFREE